MKARVTLAAAALVAAVAALLLLERARPGAGDSGPDPGERPPAARAGAPAPEPPLPTAAPPAPAVSPGPPPEARGSVPLDVWADPAGLSPEEIEARRQHRLERSRRALERYQQHPPFSRPLAENEDQVVPEQIAATLRPLAEFRPEGPPPAVEIRQTQDRVFLRPGTVATVGLEAAVDGRRVKAAVLSAVLVRWTGGGAAADPVLEVSFEEAGPVLVASFAAPAGRLGGWAGDLLLRVEAEAAGERGTLVYAFVYTGEAPAAFTGAIRDRLENGSVVFDVGIDVRRPGRYRFVGRIDDASGEPLALARFDGELAAGRVAVPLVLFGKIARDASAASPFALRDVEGFRLLDGVYPDRETMEPWAGPHRSRAYGPEELSPEAWDGGAGPAPRRDAP